MSMELMVRVITEADLTRPQQAVLVAMAENAWDDGSHCFPSVDKIAWKAGYKPRNVIDIMRELRKMGILEEVKPANARRATEYQIHLDKAPPKQTFEEWQKANGRHVRGAISREVQNDEGCNLTSLGVQSHVLGVQSHVQTTRENAPEPVIEPLEPVKEPVRGDSVKSNVTFIEAPSPPLVNDQPAPSPRKRKSETTFPEDMVLNRDRLAYAVAQGMSEQRARRQFERFHNQALATDRRQKDWEASWRNWVLGEIDRYGRDVRTFNEGDDPDINPDTGKPYRYNDARSRKVFVG